MASAGCPFSGQRRMKATNHAVGPLPEYVVPETEQQPDTATAKHPKDLITGKGMERDMFMGKGPGNGDEDIFSNSKVPGDMMSWKQSAQLESLNDDDKLFLFQSEGEGHISEAGILQEISTNIFDELRSGTVPGLVGFSHGANFYPMEQRVNAQQLSVWTQGADMEAFYRSKVHRNAVSAVHPRVSFVGRRHWISKKDLPGANNAKETAEFWVAVKEGRFQEAAPLQVNNKGKGKGILTGNKEHREAAPPQIKNKNKAGGEDTARRIPAPLALPAIGSRLSMAFLFAISYVAGRQHFRELRRFRPVFETSVFGLIRPQVLLDIISSGYLQNIFRTSFFQSFTCQ